MARTSNFAAQKRSRFAPRAQPVGATSPSRGLGPLEDWTAIVLAGQRPGPDPLAEYFGLAAKAVVPVCGTPMLTWVLRTLLSVPSIAKVVVLAQEPDVLLSILGWPLDHPRIVGMTSTSGISDSLSRIVGQGDAAWPILITTADHPLLTREMVESFMLGSRDLEVSVGAVERETVLAAYPSSVRTWLKFSDGAFSGANLFALRGDGTCRALKLWASAEKDRKHALKLFWHFGPRLAFRAATRTIGFDAALRRAGRKLGLRAGLVALDFAEAAIDVDKLSDHSEVEGIMRKSALL